MTEREEADFREMLESAAEEQGGECPVCDKPLRRPGAVLQWGHILPQTRGNLKKYGAAIIHHRLNGWAVCSGECNQAVSMRTHPVAEAALVAAIRQRIKEDG